MSPLAKTLEGVAVIIGSLALGYLARKRGWLREEKAGSINRSTLTFLSPWVSLVAMWALKSPGGSVLALPAICALVILLTGPLAVWSARRLFPDRPSRGPWVLCAMFSNQGTTYGAFLCYLLLGTQGAALGLLFMIPLGPMLYLLGFYLAGRYAEGGATSPWQAVQQALRQGYSRNPLLGLALGLGLLAWHVPLPSWGPRLLDVIIPLETGLQLLAIGATLHFSLIPRYWRPVALMHGVKFLLAPALGLGLATLLGLWGQADNDLVRVVLIQSATPVAITAVVISAAARLNVGLATSLWVSTNLFAVLCAPLLLALARAL